MTNMGAIYPLHCRYEAGHGEFANGIALLNHYKAMHPGYIKNPRGKCSACRASLMYASFRSHKLSAHPRDDTPQFIEDRIQPKRTAVAVQAPVARPEPQRPPHGHTAGNPGLFGTALFRTADDIVMPAITAMALPGNTVPVAALGALFAWRDATALMLREVSGHADSR